MSLVRKGQLHARSLRHSAPPVTLGVAKGEIMEGGLDEAEISIEFVLHEQLSRPDLGYRHEIKGLFYEANPPEWDMIMGFNFLDIAHAPPLPRRRNLLVKEAGKLKLLSTSMEPRLSLWEPAERDAPARAVRSVMTRPPTADMEDEYGLSEDAFHMALGELRLSTPAVDVFGSTALRKCPRVWTMDGNG